MKTYFKYGTMNSGKSLELIKIHYNYKSVNVNSILINHAFDTRKKNKIYSRSGAELDVDISINKTTTDIEFETQLKEQLNVNRNIILVEESQFLTKNQVDFIINISENYNIEAILFFGLKNDFTGHLFEGSRRLLERVDVIEEIVSVCWCGKKAKQNARINEKGEIIKEGKTIKIDNKEDVKYVSLCNKHFYREK